MTETIYQILDRIEGAEEIAVPANASPLDFLCAVYRDANQPMSRRLRAAIEAAPYAHPKLAVTASIGPDSGLGRRLEIAIERSRMVINGKSPRRIGEAEGD
jgi:hypothetical protein